MHSNGYIFPFLLCLLFLFFFSAKASLENHFAFLDFYLLLKYCFLAQIHLSTISFCDFWGLVQIVSSFPVGLPGFCPCGTRRGPGRQKVGRGDSMGWLVGDIIVMTCSPGNGGSPFSSFSRSSLTSVPWDLSLWPGQGASLAQVVSTSKGHLGGADRTRVRLRFQPWLLPESQGALKSPSAQTTGTQNLTQGWLLCQWGPRSPQSQPSAARDETTSWGGLSWSKSVLCEPQSKVLWAVSLGLFCAHGFPLGYTCRWRNSGWRGETSFQGQPISPHQELPEVSIPATLLEDVNLSGPCRGTFAYTRPGLLDTKWQDLRHTVLAPSEMQVVFGKETCPSCIQAEKTAPGRDSDPGCSSIPLEAWPSSPLMALPSHPYSFKWCTDKGGPGCLVNYYLCEDLWFKSIYTSTFHVILSPGPLPSLWVSENWASMWLTLPGVDLNPVFWSNH